MKTRQQAITKLKAGTHDVLVIGGGASGLGVALDAATRGLATALVEANDYAGATSGVSTKLVHGGVRYLEKAARNLDRAQYQLVREALRERQYLLDNAPHLAHQFGLLVPLYSHWERLYYGAGLWFYDKIAQNSRVSTSRYLSKEATKAAFPLIQTRGLKGSLLYFDGQFNDALYAANLARSACHHGAAVCNHLRVIELLKSTGGKVEGAVVEDTLHPEDVFTIRARVVVNCTGPQADSLRLMANPAAEKRLRPSRGIHIVLPKPPGLGYRGLIVPDTDDKRVVFVLPWLNSLFIGTTDTEVEDPMTPPRATEEEIEYLLEHANRYLGIDLDRSDLTAVFAGNRPLVAQSGKSQRGTAHLIRNHEVEFWPELNFMSLLGGKWTTYRQMAEDTVDAVELFLKGHTTACRTAQLRLVGCVEEQPISVRNILNRGRIHLGEPLPQDIQYHLSAYGSDRTAIVKLMEDVGVERLERHYPYTTAEAEWVVEGLQAVTIADVLDNRLRIRVQSAQAAYNAAPKVAGCLAKVLSWTAEEVERNIAAYQADVQFDLDLLAGKSLATRLA